MANFIVIAILICIVGSSIAYLYRAKKRGETCIGCPYSKQCGGHCNGGTHHAAKSGHKDPDQ